MARNYTLVTIKELFGQALSCAYPGCDEPLVFEDRHARTVVAQIAHIRSEATTGPRYDPNFTGDINGADNLLLLCGKHHPPVDRHESIYPTEELLVWKAAQKSNARGGTPISDSDAQVFIRLSSEERQAIAQVARLATRVEHACRHARDEQNVIQSGYRRALQAMRASFGPAWEIDDDGNDVVDNDGKRINVSNNMQMSPVDKQRWQEAADKALANDMPAVRAAVNALDEEVNVLRMMNPTIGRPANVVVLSAEQAAQMVTNEELMDQAIERVHASVRNMWLSATGD